MSLTTSRPGPACPAAGSAMRTTRLMGPPVVKGLPLLRSVTLGASSRPKPGAPGALGVRCSAVQPQAASAKAAPQAPAMNAPLPQWVQRLTGAFLLVPVLVLGAAPHAQAARRQAAQAPAAPPPEVRTNPLYDAGVEMAKTPQARAAAALATVMVGYGLVRASTSTSPAARALAERSAAGSGSAAADGGYSGLLPPTSELRLERLDELYQEIERLKRRNQLVWQLASELMQRDASLSVEQATVLAAESMGVERPQEVAAAAIADNSRAVAERLQAAEPEAGTAAAAAAAAAAGAAAAGATAAAAVATEVAGGSAGGVGLRPSGGATRGAAGGSSLLPGAGREGAVAPPERSGGASARSGPTPVADRPAGQWTAPPPERAGGASARGSPAPASDRPTGQAPVRPGGASARGGMPTDSSRVPPVQGGEGPGLVAWADSLVHKAATPPSQRPPAASNGNGASAATPAGMTSYSNPTYDAGTDGSDGAASGAAPAARTVRGRAPPSRPAPRTFPARAQELPQGPVRPSFDVSAGAAAPESFLRDSNGVTQAGAFNPSFASPTAATPSAATPASSASGSAASTAPASPAAAPASGPTWYNPLSWFARPADEDAGSGSHPSFDPSLATDYTPMAVKVVDATAAAAAPTAAAATGAGAAGAGAAGAAGAGAAASDVGMGAAAAASTASWSAALRSGPAAHDFGPVEQVAELLDVAMKTEEFVHPKYDPLRNVLASASAPSAAHKYDMIRALLRPAPAVQRSAAEEERARKYDLIYDLLRSLRTAGEPEAILASSDPKYDPVWCLLNMRAPEPGSVPKYDLVGTLLKAALAASPQPSRYDPLQLILKAQPITGSFKYCVAEVLLRGSWQDDLNSGLRSLPSWDPAASVVGPSARQQQQQQQADEQGGAAAPSPSPAGSPMRGGRVRASANKYDMMAQVVRALEELPQELASGSWAAKQPRDLLVGARPSAPARARRSGGSDRLAKYDMVGAAFARMGALPDELASGRFAAANGRELLVDTVSRTVEEGGWGLLRRVRNGGQAVAGAVGKAVRGAMGLPVDSEQPAARGSGASWRGGGRKAEPVELPAMVYSFEGAGGGGSGSKAGRAGRRDTHSEQQQEALRKREEANAAAVTAAATIMPAGKAPATAPAPAPTRAPSMAPSEQQRLDRGVVPPARKFNRTAAPPVKAASASSPSHHHLVDKSAIPSLPYVDAEALFAALSETEDEKAAAAAAIAAAASETLAGGAATLSAAAAALQLPDVAVDLLVLSSVQGSRGAAPPGMEGLVERFGPGIEDVAAQVRSARVNAPLLARHPQVAKLLGAAAAAHGRADKGDMFSELYQLLGAVRGAEGAMVPFLADLKEPYPLLHGLLTTGDAAQGVSVLCALCSLVPPAAEGEALPAVVREERMMMQAA